VCWVCCVLGVFGCGGWACFEMCRLLLNRFGALKSSLHFFNCVETALSGSLLGAT